MNVLVPFYCFFAGDSSTTSFVLDLVKDGFYYDTTNVTFNGAIPKPNVAAIKVPAHGSYAVGAFDCSATDISNGGARGSQSGGSMTVSTTQNQVTFTLSSAPATGVLAFDGFIQYA